MATSASEISFSKTVSPFLYYGQINRSSHCRAAISVIPHLMQSDRQHKLDFVLQAANKTSVKTYMSCRRSLIDPYNLGFSESSFQLQMLNAPFYE